jgi:Ca-activated chloride channel family protein
VSFEAPLFLLALALIPAGLIAQRLAARRRRRYAVRFPAVATVAAVLPRTPAWRRRLPAALLAATVALLAVTLARPERTVAVPVEQASVMLVLDASGSMEATDVAPSRLAAAEDAAVRFLQRVPKNMKVGLVAYSTAPHTIQAPTTDREALRLTILSLYADGGTATGDALATAMHALGRDVDDPTSRSAHPPPAAIVLLSDGKAMGGRDPDQVAQVAGRLHVPIYTVALGTPDGTVEGPFGASIPVPPDPGSLRRYAKESGGEAFEAADAARLSQVYESLGSRLGSKPERRQATAGFAGISLVLLALATALGVRWRGRLP